MRAKGQARKRGSFGAVAVLLALLTAIPIAGHSQNSIPSLVSPTGTLALHVIPSSAALTLDGKQIGPAGTFHEELSAGTHEIEISAEGYEPVKQTVTIVAGETLRVALQLALIRPLPPPPTRGTLVLDVRPPGAVLKLDGKQVGPAKGFNQELPAGPHEIEISARGYVAAKKTVTITAGKALPVSLSLSPVPPRSPTRIPEAADPPVAAHPPATVRPPPPPTSAEPTPPTNPELTRMQVLRQELEQLPQGKYTSTLRWR
jgi:hypothetical protein